MAEQLSTHEQEPTVSATVVEGTGARAVGTTVKVITEVPGFEGSGGYRAPETTVAEINDALADRDPKKPAPKVFPGTNQLA